MRTAIVTASDAKYLVFLTDLLDSIDRCRPREGKGCEFDICVLDVGMSAEQKGALAGRAARIVEPGWDYEFPGRDRLPRHFQALFSRPQLPKHLPGYDRYVWVDADVWMQDWRGMELLLEASEDGVMAIVPEIHQSYGHLFRQKPSLERELKLYYETSFGAETGRWLASLPVYNAGVWAMRADLVYWRNWGDVLRRALQKFTGFLSEQCSLNMAIYTGLVSAYPLPAWCNWMCSEALPALDVAGKAFCSPLLPHEKLSMVHLADVKHEALEVGCIGGGRKKVELTYSGAMGV